jgi:hypothetical protein
MLTARGLAPLLSAALIVTAALATGCGSGSSAFSTTRPAATATTATATRSTTTTAATPVAAPTGRLTASEYVLFLRVTRAGDAGTRHVHNPRKIVATLRRLCAMLDRGSPTRLVLADRRACPREIRWVRALLAFETEGAACKRAAAAGDISCYGELYWRIARATHPLVASAREVNAVLDRRAISGRCADGIGVASRGEIVSALATARDARLASQALYARNLPRYLVVGKRFAAELDKLTSDDSGNELEKIRTCPHD